MQTGVELLGAGDRDALTRRAETIGTRLMMQAGSGSMTPPARAFFLGELLRVLDGPEDSAAVHLAVLRRAAVAASVAQGATPADLAVTLGLTRSRVYQMRSGTGRCGVLSRPLVAGPGPGRPSRAAVAGRQVNS